MNKYHTIFKRCLIFLCIPLLVVVMIINIATPDKAKSSTENRTLQTFPEFHKEDVIDGTYESSLNTWFSDQFVARNTFIQMKYYISKYIGNKKIDDVYLSEDCLIEEAQTPSDELSRNLKAINTFVKKHKDLHTNFILVPNAISIHQDKLPSFIDTTIQDAQMDTIYKTLSKNTGKIDVRKTLVKHKDEYLYYKTDHHYTSLGAFYTFKQFAKTNKLGTITRQSYNIYPVTNTFTGTLANKTGCKEYQDEIDLFVPKKNKAYLIEDSSSKDYKTSIYSSKGLESDDPYTVFLGGNTSIVKINIDTDSDKHLLIFKDSYANSFIQFLIPYYRSITIVDPRYYFDDIKSVIKQDNITDILFLYNTNTFVQDTSLADVLE